MSVLAEQHARLLIEQFESRTGEAPEDMWVSKAFHDMIFEDAPREQLLGVKQYIFCGVRVHVTPVLEGYGVFFTNPLTPARRWDELRQAIMEMRTGTFISSVVPSGSPVIQSLIDQVLLRILDYMNQLDDKKEIQ